LSVHAINDRPFDVGKSIGAGVAARTAFRGARTSDTADTGAIGAVNRHAAAAGSAA
jgi:hypothetical protein